MPDRLRRTARRWRGETGATLVELIVAVGLITMSVTMVGAPMFPVIRANEDWRNGLSATANLRQAAGYLSRDASNAQTVSLGDGSPSTDSITMVWVSDTTHTVDYALSVSGDTLLRTDNGGSVAVARRVAGVEFSRAGNLLTMALDVHASQGATKTIDALAALRSLD